MAFAYSSGVPPPSVWYVLPRSQHAPARPLTTACSLERRRNPSTKAFSLATCRSTAFSEGDQAELVEVLEQYALRELSKDPDERVIEAEFLPRLESAAKEGKPLGDFLL